MAPLREAARHGNFEGTFVRVRPVPALDSRDSRCRPVHREGRNRKGGGSASVASPIRQVSTHVQALMVRRAPRRAVLALR